MFRDFIYLDINRIQSIIAQLQQGLLNEVMEGKTEQTSGRAMVNLLAMLLPVSASVEHGRGTSVSESRVLHDYAFEEAVRSLREEGFLLEADDLDRDDIPETGFVLVRGSAQIMDFETYQTIAGNVDKIDKVFGTAKTPEQKKQSKTIRESKVIIDTFYRDAIRVRVTNPQGCRFIGPLIREHLRDEIRALIYKHGSRPKGAWSMLAEISRVPGPNELFEEMVAQEEIAEGSVSHMLDQMIGQINELQEYIGSASYPDIAVSPIAVYREINPNP